jgi:uncharacterized protein
MMLRISLLLAVLCSGCAQAPEAEVDPAIANALAQTKAIDNHAHPVRPTMPGEAPDIGFDALPVESLEPSSDLVRFRPGQPVYAEAGKAIFGGDRTGATKEWGSNYAARVLDKARIDRMVANRVSMGPGLPRERFLWAAYADALMYPFPTDGIAGNSDRKAFFALEAKLLGTYYRESGLTERPASLDEYLSKAVSATLIRHKEGGAVAEKFEMAYLRPLAVENVSRDEAARAWRAADVSSVQYRVLQDYLFRYIAMECGRLGMAVHIHTGAGAGGYYDTAGANPGLLEPLLNDPALRKTNFVMVHGGWPYSGTVAPLLVKPNAYVDFSAQGLILPASEIARALRTWLEMVPEKVLFGTDAYPFAPAAGMGWEETAWVSSQTGRRALGMALTAMAREGSVTQERAVEIGKLVLRENAAKLYRLK